jgi:hypothetical protein
MFCSNQASVQKYLSVENISQVRMWVSEIIDRQKFKNLIKKINVFLNNNFLNYIIYWFSQLLFYHISNGLTIWGYLCIKNSLLL